MPARVLLGGEGSNELGGWSREPEYRDREPEPGVLEALLRRVRADGWEVVDAVAWKAIRKFRAGRHADAEIRNVLGLALMARERGADVIVFTRDRDGDGERADSIEAGISRVAEVFPDGPRVVGGVAVPMLEGWVVALAGKRGSEELRRDELGRAIAALGLSSKDTRGMTGRVATADLQAIPADAASLRTWLDRAGAVLGAA